METFRRIGENAWNRHGVEHVYGDAGYYPVAGEIRSAFPITGVATCVRLLLALMLLAFLIMARPAWITAKFEAYEGWPAE